MKKITGLRKPHSQTTVRLLPKGDEGGERRERVKRGEGATERDVTWAGKHTT